MSIKHNFNNKPPEALFAELEACFVSIMDIELPALESRLGRSNQTVADIKATCQGGLLLTETLRLRYLEETPI